MEENAATSKSSNKIDSKPTHIEDPKSTNENPGVSNQKTFCCPYCSFSTSRSLTYTIHLKKHHVKLKKMCPSCFYTAPTYMKLKEHIETKVHRDINCPNCDFKAQSLSQLGKHMKTHNKRNVKSKDREINKCKYCDVTLKDTKRHIETCHECLRCQFKTPKGFLLAFHYATKHAVDDFECPFCSDSDSRKCLIEYQKHLYSHMEPEVKLNKWEKCPDCSQFFKYMDLPRHMLKHVAFECQFCSFIDIDEEIFRKHVQMVHQNVNFYKCPYCNYKAGLLEGLEKHVLEGCKQFECFCPQCV